jgi:hypothetical protein
MKNSYRILVEKSEDKTSFGKSEQKWEYIIETDF